MKKYNLLNHIDSPSLLIQHQFISNYSSLNNILEINERNINNYKNNLCSIAYSEEPITSNSITYDFLKNYLNLKNPYQKNKNNFVYENFDDNLTFNSKFESGNLRMAVKHNNNEYDLIIRPETNCIRNYQWFYFSVKENKKLTNPIIKFNIINLTKKSILFNENIRVLCYYDNCFSRDTQNIFYYENKIPNYNDKRLIINNNNIQLNQNNNNNNLLNSFSNDLFYNINNNINSFINIISENSDNENNKDFKPFKSFNSLSFSFDFSKINSSPKIIYFSYCYPYTYTHLNNFFSTLIPYKNYLRFENLGQTLLNRNLHMLIITDFTDSFENLAKKTCIFITGRVHPGESNSSFVVQGLIEFLLSNDNTADKLRKYYIFKIIPMLNPDGVIFGNFRMNIEGKDLNRTWNDYNPEINPTICYSHNVIQKTLNSRKIFLYCDFHGHSNKNNFFIYSCKIKNEKKKFTELILPYLYKIENDIFDKKSCVDKIAPDKINTGRAVLKTKYCIDFSYCLESSMGCYKSQNGLLPFTIEDYKKIGKDFCKVLLKLNNNKIFFNTLNYIRNEKKQKKQDKKNKKKMILPMINIINNGNGKENSKNKQLNTCINRTKSDLFKSTRNKKLNFNKNLKIDNNNNNNNLNFISNFVPYTINRYLNNNQNNFFNTNDNNKLLLNS